MRYQTKEWCALNQQTSYHLNLHISPKAEICSEAYYRRLFSRRRREALESAQMAAEWAGRPFDLERERQAFLLDHQHYVQTLSQVLPPALLAQVSDLRVLALGISTQAVKEQLTQWCEENRRQVDQILQEAAADPDRVSLPAFCFHDGSIAAMEWEGRDLILKTQDACFTSATGVRFENARVLEQDEDLVGSLWLYEEVYQVPGGREYHMLLLRNGKKYATLLDALAYLTVFAENITFLSQNSSNSAL